MCVYVGVCVRESEWEPFTCPRVCVCVPHTLTDTHANSLMENGGV